MSANTLLLQLIETAERQPEHVALRTKSDGSWHDLTWARYLDRSLDVGAGLMALGLELGERVGLLSTNSARWLMCDYGMMAVGAASVPIYPNSIASQVRFILKHAGCSAIAVEDLEQLDKILTVWDELPDLRFAVLLSDQPCADPRVHRFSDIEETGRDLGDSARTRLAQCYENIPRSALATVVYTSGTTGPPKGAMLSHGNLLASANALCKILDVGPEDSSLSFLPLSHVAERLQGQIVPARAGYTVNMGEGLEKVVPNLLETEPTILLCVPRLWEKMYAGISEGLESAPELRRKLFDWAHDVGKRCFAARASGSVPSPFLLLQEGVADRLVHAPLRKRLGLARTKRFASGAAPLSVEVATFFAGLGIVIQEVYGQTECVGVSNCNPIERPRFGTVGPALDVLDVKLGEDDEVLVRGPTVFLGYLNDEEATERTVVQGWLYTGDVGEIDDDGYLRLTDRKKDIIVTAGGKNVSPQNIENRLKVFPGISQAVVIGDARRFLAALFTADREGLQNLWDREGHGKLPSEEALASDPRIQKIFRGYVDRVNQILPRHEQLKTFRILPRDFTVESGELTPSLKVKRRFIQKSYLELIDAIYDEAVADHAARH